MFKNIDIFYIIIILILGVMVWAIFCGGIRAEEWTDEQIVNAIWCSEGKDKATYLYGIRSVHYSDEAEARKICFNTVRNNRKRYADYGYKQYATYLEFLASRYCPVSAHPLNKNWLKNVEYFLKKGAK